MATFPRFRDPGRAASGTEAAILHGGNMATQPGGGAVVGSSKATPQKSFFWSCFSCRMLAGSGLAGAGLWVHLGVRRSLPYSRPGNLYNIFRLVFAIGLYSSAILIILDPVEPK